MHTLPRRIGKAIIAMLCGMVLLYVLLISTLHIPAVQRKLAHTLATELSQQLSTEVEIGSVNLGFLNRLTASDILLRDNARQPLLRLSRISVTLNPLRLLKGEVQITTLQLFGLQATLSRTSPQEPLNCQFLIDALASDSDDNQADSPLTLAIRTLLIRHAHITYTVATDTLPPLHITDLALTATLFQDNEGNINLQCKRLSFNELRTGLQLNNLRFECTIEDNEISLTPLTLTSNVADLTAAESKLTINELGLASASIEKPTLTIHPQLIDSLLPTPLGQALTLYTPSITLADKTWKSDSLTATFTDEIATLSTAVSFSLCDTTLTLSDLNISAHPALIQQLIASYRNTWQESNSSFLILHSSVALSPTRSKASLTFQTPDNGLNILSSDINGAARIEIEGTYAPAEGLQARAQATIDGFTYNSYSYPAITIDATARGTQVDATLTTQGTDIDLRAYVQATISYLSHNQHAKQSLQADIDIHHLDAHALHLTDSFPDEHLSAQLHFNAKDKNLNLSIDSLTISTPQVQYHLAELAISQTFNPHTGYTLTADGDFVEMELTMPSPLNSYLLPQTSYLLPQASNLTLHLTDAAILRHLLPIDFTLQRPLSVQADTHNDSLTIHLTAPALSLDGIDYHDIALHATRPQGNAPLWLGWNGTASLTRNAGNTHTTITLDAYTHQDTLSTHLNFAQQAKTDLAADIQADIILSNSAHDLTAILHPSTLTAGDTLWHISPARIEYQSEGRIHIDHLNIASTCGERALNIHGALAPQDTLSITLRAIQIPYITDLVDFTAVSFLGDVSGIAMLTQTPDGTPDFSANLTVPNFHFETAPLGSAQITVNYAPTRSHINIDADIIDSSDTILRRTTCRGYVAPANNDILLHVTAENTNAAFLGDYLGSIFNDMHGQANGYIDVVGPLSEVNLVGDMSADVTMTLRPTNVTYHIDPRDTIRLRPYLFSFNDIRLHDSYGGTALCNGQVTHRNVKNFTYTLDATLQHLLAYSEHQFNADKFMGDVTVDGSLSINGSDGHPLHINADVTPAGGSGYTEGSTPSFFAYDAATPDPIASANFITYRTTPDSLLPPTSSLLPPTSSLLPQTSSDYSSDIYMDIAVHLNPLCDIALRMDNYDDAFIHTYGTGELLAHYHNKSPFTLQGTYYINDGSYRLYLQDLIYRDLTLQSGSSVTFNGNPFDANIHLICNHTLPAVPLSDLTADATVTSTGRAKVVCILDITGQLGNMLLDFDYELPNETEETKQLVKSLIYTDEERNMQMVYLLALGRFYSSEYARATGQTDNSQAINSLLTSTISGQLNQMISSLIGTQSNWQFGTGISTGDYGLEDLDIEGILSGRLFNDRLLINGNFGYRDNALTQNASFIGDFDLSWRLKRTGHTFLKAYNKANDRYFTKNALNTQGIGISWQKEFEKGK